MLTDEQLIDRLRAELDALQPPADLIQRLRRQAAERPQGARARLHMPDVSGRPWSAVRFLPLLASAVLSVAIAAGAFLLLYHRRSSPTIATSSGRPVPHNATGGHEPGPGRASTRNLPARVQASEVAAPLKLRALPVAGYCGAVASQRVTRCRSGQRPITGRPQRLIQLSVIIRRSTGVHSSYAWEVTAPKACSRANTSGPSYQPVKAGSLLVFDALFPPNCHGLATAAVSYVTHAPNADVERLTLVGRATLRVP